MVIVIQILLVNHELLSMKHFLSKTEVALLTQYSAVNLDEDLVDLHLIFGFLYLGS